MSEEITENLADILSEENQHETVALARALCPFAEGAPDMTVLLCVAFVEAGGDLQAVAQILGMEKSSINRHLRSKVATQIIKKLAKDRLAGEGYLKAVCSLIEVASSQAQTGNARNNASKTIMELVEAENARVGGSDDDGIDLNNMTLKQLEAFVGGIKQELIKLPNVNQIIDNNPTGI